MPDALLVYLRHTLPDDIRPLLLEKIDDLENGRFEELLSLPLARLLLGHQDNDHTRTIDLKSFPDWNDYVFTRLEALLANRQGVGSEQEDSPQLRQHTFFIIALAALQSFLQSNVTGPPLPYSSGKTLFPQEVSQDPQRVKDVRSLLISSLSVDGEAAYKLIPNPELLCLTDTILTCPPIKKLIKSFEWAKVRTDFVHQRILSETSSTLQRMIYESLDAVRDLLTCEKEQTMTENLYASFLLESASIQIHHGFDKQARINLESAAKRRDFQFALTGLLGKRTKYQQNDLSQLVVLAKSKDSVVVDKQAPGASRPENLDLNDDTLLESISFAEKPESSTDVVDPNALPSTLTELNPEKQPLLSPEDSIILLLLASSITNTSPTDGLTREQTIPYATRVLEGGSSNWQIYSQALLVRSRIEGYRARTTERGLLQLQSLVDQVIIETTPTQEGEPSSSETPSTFLPRPKESESATAGERLEYIHPLCSPLRWEIESELASRWVSMGGMKSALEIFERLQMWPEAALCWAAANREDKARRMVRKLLFHAANEKNESEIDEDTENWDGPTREPPPSDAPRLYCILGDIDRDPSMYEKAWEVSNGRYARAQRSLGRLYFAKNDYVNSAAAYSKSLKINQLNQSSWFALGCALLQLSEFDKAAEAFSRTVQLDDTDAEAWSNLATALLRKGAPASDGDTIDLSDDSNAPDPKDSQKHKKDALSALKRAAALKHDDFRIWDNLLTVAASLTPPAYTEVVAAQRRIIALRGTTDGENCIDTPILEHLLRHVVANYPAPDPASAVPKSDLPRLVADLVEKHVTPLITASTRLWSAVATVALWRNRPSAALAAQEKAWRAAMGPLQGVETAAQWEELVSETVELCDAYENLGPRERTEGLAAGSGELVAKDWRFKARSAVRGALGKGKELWEGSEGWETLEGILEELKQGK